MFHAIHAFRRSGNDFIPIVKDQHGNEREAVWAPQPGSQELFLAAPEIEVLYEGTRGPGKRILLSEKVLTKDGWKPAGEITIKDKLVAPDGTYVRVLGIYPGESLNMNRVAFDDGSSLVVDDEHFWSVYDGRNCRWSVRTTQWISERKPSRSGWHIPLIDSPVPGPQWDGYDPYIIGAMIGDGTMSGSYPTIYTKEPELCEYLVRAGWTTYDYPEYRRGGVKQMTLLGRGAHDLVCAPREKGDCKYIPEKLLHADPASRLAVLQGLMDTDGHCDKDGRCEFTSVSEQLAKDVQYLARSLGGKARVHWQYTDPEKGFGSRDYYYRVKVTHAGKFVPFRLPRHIARLNMDQHGARRRIESITPVGKADGVCFYVDHPSHLFVVQDFIVTHNTDALIMDFCQHVGAGYGAEWRGVLFRQTHPQLRDVIEKSKKWIKRIWPNAFYNEIKYFWEWESGERLYFSHFETPSQYYNYHGHAYPWIGWEELTTWPTPDGFKLMFSCSRSTVPGMPRKIRATTNPYGCVRFGEVLTENGWVDIKNFEDGLKVLSVSPEGAMSFSHATRHSQDFSGDMVTRNGRGVFMEFTNDHRLPYLKADGQHRLRHFYDLPKTLSLIRDVGEPWAGGADVDLKQFGNRREKFIPRELLHASLPVMERLFDRLMIGDGHWSTENSGHYYTLSKRLADDVSELCVKLGYRTRVTSQQREGRRLRCYEVSFSPSKPFWLSDDLVETSSFEGQVYCLKVPGDETFFIRQNGCIWLSGNCGHNWVKARYRLPIAPGDICGPLINDAIDEHGNKEPPRRSIHGHLDENQILMHTDPGYKARIRAAARNASELHAWMDGSWDIVAGGMFDDIWYEFRDSIVVPPFHVPPTWTIRRAYDHGQSKPFSVGWYAESDGSDLVFEDGRIRSTLRGDLFRVQEWYGWRGQANEGSRMLATEIAKGIVEREIKWGWRSVDGKKSRVKRGPADNMIFDDDNGVCIADDFEKSVMIGNVKHRGIVWERADKGPGSREQGWEQVRKRLKATKRPPGGVREEPGLFISKYCQHWLRCVPTLPRDDKHIDDVDDESEDHNGDETRYMLRFESHSVKSGRVG